MNRQAIDWEKRFVNHIFDKGMVSRIYKEFLKVNHRKTNNPITIGPNFEKALLSASRYMQKRPSSIVIR